MKLNFEKILLRNIIVVYVSRKIKKPKMQEKNVINALQINHDLFIGIKTT